MQGWRVAARAGAVLPRQPDVSASLAERRAVDPTMVRDREPGGGGSATAGFGFTDQA
ncbi:MAG TPA: hypothetical protein VFE41_17565 [Acetobacteraceae bacterium]|jgi:hypothetical protein|nr:hypothetical protein [Acetobacteraceae bacterium]